MLAAGAIEATFRAERARVLATTIRVVNGDFDLAEEIVQDAFAAALARWPAEGTPDEPRAWLISVARNKAIDTIRRRVKLREIVAAEDATEGTATSELVAVPDDRLRLMYTCCHPALAPEAQVALTLRTLGGLTTDEIARAYLATPATMAQRLVRAKAKIRDARIPYVVPEASELAERTEQVMAVAYLIFNEGYAATAGDSWLRRDLCREAIRLARLLVELADPASLAEARGLLALMLLHDSRRDARTDGDGDLVLLEDQDRARWDHAQIAEALALVPDALRGGPGPYALQAAIAALHAQAKAAADTDWPQITALFHELYRRTPTAVIALNRAAAIAMWRGPAFALPLVDELKGELADYPLWHAARADLLRRLGKQRESLAAYRAALARTTNEPERRFLERRITALTAS
ncbi:MAG: sigma-70 family RNA polymerase sigma factor [Deltaproteobacteria bacterium]|nr:sigma-70 family RNA polymerase sigma factor [Deltaproteobacteria bacterium]MCW5803816.1 sigma-70 family RNA polymerase sigma factor [Deltaproteobacteria bacterium]